MRKEIIILGAITLLVIIGVFVGSSFYRSSVQNERVVTVNSNTGNSNSGNTSSTNTAITPETLVRPDSAALGRADAPVTLVEFLDPECESCAAFAPNGKSILNDYKDKVRLVVRYMPLHPNSLTAATFTEAAGEQGKYWEAQELLFAKQGEWGTRHGPHGDHVPPNISELFKGYAKELGLDMAKMDAVFASNKYKEKVDRDLKDGQALGVRQTPSFFVNGRRLARFSESDLRALIDDELKQVASK